MFAENRFLQHIERNIIISNINTSIDNNKNFDAIYFDIYDAFHLENELLNKNSISKLSVYFSQGEHFFINSNLNVYEKMNKISRFFQNINTTIVIQPLFCEMINLTDLCVENNEKPIIYFKSLAISICIAYHMEIYYIRFNFIETLYPYSSENNSCLVTKNKTCCTTDDLIKNKNPCNIFYKNVSEKLFVNPTSNALFVIEGFKQETIFFIKYCVFEQFLLLEPSNQLLNSIISISYSLAILEISNVEINEIFTFRSLISIDFQESSLNKDTLFIMIANASFNNFNKYKIKLNFANTAKYAFVLYINNKHGEFLFQNLYFSNFFSLTQNNPPSMFLFEKISNTKLENLYFLNIEFFDLFSFESSLANLTVIVIKNMSVGKIAFNISYDSQIFFNKIIIMDSFTINLSTLSYFQIKSSQVRFQNLFCINDHNLNFFFYLSEIHILDSIFLNITNQKEIFLVSAIFSKVFFLNDFFHKMNANFFSLIECDQVILSNNNFFNLTSETFLYGNFIRVFNFFNVNVQNIKCLDDFINIDSIQNFSINNSICYFVEVFNYFLNILNGNFYGYNISFENIFCLDQKNVGFISIINNNLFLLINSKLWKIYFLFEGKQIFYFFQSSITIDNCSFVNNGQIYQENITNEAVFPMVYLVACYDAYFFNNKFINHEFFYSPSGFLSIVVHRNLLYIMNNSFVIRKINQICVNFLDCPFVFLQNNYFEGSPNFEKKENKAHNCNMKIHSKFFVVLAQNNFIFLLNNIFYNCMSESGGSFEIKDYISIMINETKIINSIATFRGGAFTLFNIKSIEIHNMVIINSSSLYGGNFYIFKANFTFINELFVENGSNFKGGLYFSEINFLYVKNLISLNQFSRNSGGAMIIDGGFCVLERIYIRNSISLSKGGALLIQRKITTFLINSYIINCISNYGGFLYVNDANYLEINGSYLTNIVSNKNGGCFYISEVFNISLNKIILTQSKVGEFGLIFFNSINPFSYFSLINGIMINNSANYGSVLYADGNATFLIQSVIVLNAINLPFSFTWVFPIDIQIYDLTINSSFIKQFIFYFSRVNANLNSIKINNNIIQNERNGVIYFDQCPLIYVKNFSHLKANVSEKTRVFFEVYDSNITLNQIFLQSESIIFTLVSAENSYVSISESNFKNYQTEQGFIICEMSQIVINLCEFSKILGSVILSTDSNIYLNNCFFSLNIKSPYTNIQNIDLEIRFLQSNTIFIINNSFFIGEEGISIILTNVGNITIENSNFIGNSNNSQGIVVNDFDFCYIFKTNFSDYSYLNMGSALFIQNNEQLNFYPQAPSFFIMDCIFIDNKALYGGAIYLLGYIHIFISWSIFFANKAYEIGGAIKIFLFEDYLITILSSRFQNNFANVLHPNVFSSSPLMSKNNTFINNFDGMNSKLPFSSFPLKFQFVENNTKNSSSLIQFNSGTEFSLTFNLLDFYNQNFYTQEFISSIIFLDNLTMKNQINLINPISLPTKQGLLKYPYILIKAPPGTQFNLSIRIKINDFEDITRYIFEQKV